MLQRDLASEGGWGKSEISVAFVVCNCRGLSRMRVGAGVYEQDEYSVRHHSDESDVIDCACCLLIL